MSFSPLAAVKTESFEPPNPQEFYQRFFGHGDWSFTRPMVLFLVVGVVVCTYLVLTTRKAAIVPSKGQWLTEQIYAPIRNGIAQDIIGTKEFLKYVPLLFAVFCTLLLSNLMSVIPVFQFPPTGRVAFPIALTLFVYVIYQAIAFKRKGVVGYLKGLIPPGLPLWIRPMILVLEIITYFITRPVTLALRLFGNMFAGHMLLLLFITGGQFMIVHQSGFQYKIFGAGSFLMAVLMTLFEILIEFLQAYIFTLLAATYIADSIATEH